MEENSDFHQYRLCSPTLQLEMHQMKMSGWFTINTLSNLAHWTSNSTNDHLPSLILVDELLIDLSIWQYIFTVNDTTETN